MNKFEEAVLDWLEKVFNYLEPIGNKMDELLENVSQYIDNYNYKTPNLRSWEVPVYIVIFGLGVILTITGYSYYAYLIIPWNIELLKAIALFFGKLGLIILVALGIYLPIRTFFARHVNKNIGDQDR